MNESLTCREFVEPALDAAGWTANGHEVMPQHYFTDGRVSLSGGRPRRQKRKYADYLLRYRHALPLAVVEAKRIHKSVDTGLQQGMEYARILGLPFAYATNGTEIVEHDFLTGLERRVDAFPGPDELYARYLAAKGIQEEQSAPLVTPYHVLGTPRPRYYQESAIERAVAAILQGQRRVLLTLATGTGKTTIAFQICWKLWTANWNAKGTTRKPRMLFLSDRTILVNDPHDKMFAPFKNARSIIKAGSVAQSREMYFALYQSLIGQGATPRYRKYPKDFFDLIVVDECHRGSASEDSQWREILSYFDGAYQVGMTATPLREESRNSYAYFGAPVYEYTLAQGIEDGYLAPYRVHRVHTSWDVEGWRPSPGELDRYGREIPEGEYSTKDFERAISLRARTEAVARHLSEFLRASGRFDKTIVFCVDQEHAAEMRRALINENADLAQQYPDYVCRVTSDEGEIGAGHLSRFQDVETDTPVILTTSQLLTTGVDAPTVRNVVLFRVVGSMAEFKQIVGRGTRLRPDRGKLFFNILDYTGSATQHFADPDFDGFPAHVTEDTMDENGNVTRRDESNPGEEDAGDAGDARTEEAAPDTGPEESGDGQARERRKLYADGGEGGVIHSRTFTLGRDGKTLTLAQITDIAGERIRTLYPTPTLLRSHWLSSERRSHLLQALDEHDVPISELRELPGMEDADAFDVLTHLAYGAPLRTRRERAERLRTGRQDFFDRYGATARAVLTDLLAQYTDHPQDQPFVLPDSLKVPPISDRGNVHELAAAFGGASHLREAVETLQRLLYEEGVQS